ncbi:hypothetical protein D3C87_1272450 [compost metagenome]
MAEKTWEQGELFPSVTAADKLFTRRLLENYMKNKQMVEAFAHKTTLTEQMQRVYMEAKDEIENIELAVNLIQDPEIKRIIEHRFFKLRRYSKTIIFFMGNGMSESTIDRCIDRGVLSIADSLKLWGYLSKK